MHHNPAFFSLFMNFSEDRNRKTTNAFRLEGNLGYVLMKVKDDILGDCSFSTYANLPFGK